MWQNHDNFLLGVFGKLTFKKELNLIVYDLDHTVIEPIGKSRPGAPYIKWRFLKGAKARIQKDAKAKNTLIIFVTNQLYLERYVEDFRKKVEDVMKQLNVPVLFYAAKGRSDFRKPSTGILSKHLLHMFEKKGVQLISSVVYVGDAAGRTSDFNDSDRKFLHNIHLLLNSKLNPLNYGKRAKFRTPEEYFQGKKAMPFKWLGIDPKVVMDKALKGQKPSEVDISIDEYVEPADHQELILMIGPPASGKTTIAKKIEKQGYKRVNQDELKTKIKVHKAVRDYLRQGKSVVVDNTNLDPVKRDEIIKIAQEHFANTGKSVRIRAFYINGDWPLEKQVEFAKHLNIVRMRVKDIYIKDIAYRVLLSKFEPPTDSEGFTEIVNIPFVPRFKNVEHILAFLQRS
jgi:bifunctional polynucleotide phosphatase/kinase